MLFKRQTSKYAILSHLAFFLLFVRPSSCFHQLDAMSIPRIRSEITLHLCQVWILCGSG